MRDYKPISQFLIKFADNFFSESPFVDKNSYKMKILSVILILSFFASLPVRSQEEEKVKKNEFKLDLFSFIGSTFYAEYERSMSANNSLNIAIAPTALDNNEKQFYGIYLQVNPKFYYLTRGSEHNEQFLYFSPYASYRYFDISDTYYDYYYPLGYQYTGTQVIVENTFNASAAGAGVVFGYKIIAGNFFIMNFEAGGGMRYILEKGGNCNYDQVSEGYNNWNLGYNGIFPRLNLSLGFKF